MLSVIQGTIISHLKSIESHSDPDKGKILWICLSTLINRRLSSCQLIIFNGQLTRQQYLMEVNGYLTKGPRTEH